MNKKLFTRKRIIIGILTLLIIVPIAGSAASTYWNYPHSWRPTYWNNPGSWDGRAVIDYLWPRTHLALIRANAGRLSIDELSEEIHTALLIAMYNAGIIDELSEETHTALLTAMYNAGLKDNSITTDKLANDAVTDSKVVNTITASNYLPLTGGTISGNVDGLSIELGQTPSVFTTLTAGLSGGETTIPVVSTSGYPSEGTLLLDQYSTDQEAMTYTGKTSTSFTGVTRGALGTTDTWHDAGDTVKNLVFTALDRSSNDPVVVTGEGKVGIGMPFPFSKLVVHGSINVSHDEGMASDTMRHIVIGDYGDDSVRGGSFSSDDAIWLAGTWHKFYVLNGIRTDGDIYVDTGNVIVESGKVGIGSGSTPGSALHVEDGNYAQFEDNNAGEPPSGDCDNDAERGRMSIDTSNNRLYICNGATRGWDYVALTD